MLNALPKRLRALRHDRFLRAAGVLVGGTAAAQGIGLLALPLLTRFYSPEDFSLLAVYVAILTMSAAVTCMRQNEASGSHTDYNHWNRCIKMIQPFKRAVRRLCGYRLDRE